jgi:hypothetical protein
MDYSKWKEIPLPPKMRNLERDKRGYPVPYVVVRDIKGTPRFQINDENRVNNALENDLCAVCGNKMGEDRWLVGGPLSAFHPHGAYIDTPTHKECLHYALKVCPYLAISKYQARIDLLNVREGDFPDTLMFQNPTQDDERVPFFVAVKIRSFKVTRPRLGERYLHPDRDYLDLEYWNDGKMITELEAAELYEQHIQNPKKGIK